MSDVSSRHSFDTGPFRAVFGCYAFAGSDRALAHPGGILAATLANADTGAGAKYYLADQRFRLLV